LDATTLDRLITALAEARDYRLRENAVGSSGRKIAADEEADEEDKEEESSSTDSSTSSEKLAFDADEESAACGEEKKSAGGEGEEQEKGTGEEEEKKQSAHAGPERDAWWGDRSQGEWVKDEDCKNCTDCNAKFSMLKRKHHCRWCGDIFCSECSRHTAQTARIGREHAKGNEKTCRVCEGCSLLLQRGREDGERKKENRLVGALSDGPGAIRLYAMGLGASNQNGAAFFTGPSDRTHLRLGMSILGMLYTCQAIGFLELNQEWGVP
jgi:hypothetical protein